MNRPYRFRNLVFDMVMIALTGGFWLLWILVKFLRSNTK